MSFDERGAHLIDVTLEVGDLAGRDALDLALPAWTPGSYKIRDYARHVEDLRAQDPAGRPLAWTKTAKSTFRIALGEDRPDRVTVRYRLYAFERTVRTNHVDADHAFVHGAATFFHVPGELDRPARVRLRLPPGWRSATQLRPAGTPTRDDHDGEELVADDYDELADAPIECGKFRTLCFAARGLPHRVVLSGHPGNLDLARLQADLGPVIEATATIFPDPPPIPRYTFIIGMVPEGAAGGGVEHAASTAIQASRFGCRDGAGYEDLLGLCAHEYFHVWNGKRIRPRALDPFDYARETHCRALWFVEGVTSYYDELLLLRAGRLSRARYLERLVEKFVAEREQPGRLHESLQDASFDAWIKLYQRNERSPSSQVSYYRKGELAAATLDIELRRRTAGERSLDDVMRLVWERHAPPEPGYSDEQLVAAFSEVAGDDMGPFLDALVARPGEVGLREALAHAGIRLEHEALDPAAPPRPAPPSGRPPPQGPFVFTLGAHVRARSGAAQLSVVHHGGAAYDAGLSALDEILALNGHRVTGKTLEARLLDREPGEKVTLTFFRDAMLRETELTIPPPPKGRLIAVENPDAGELALKIREGWLGASSPA